MATTNPSTQGSWRRPVFILIPGAWHVPEHYSPLTSLLENAGYKVHALRLPSTIGRPTNPNHDADVVLISNLINELANAGEDVILIMHSAGGVTGGTSVQGLSKAERAERGKPGGVVRCIYVCAFAAAEGVSVFRAIGGPEDWIDVQGEFCRPTQTERVFYNDMSAEQQQFAQSNLALHSCGALWSAAAYAPFMHLPCSYFLCENDQAIPLAAQEAMVSQEGAMFDHVERCSAGHSPFVSVPELTANFLRRAAGEKIEKLSD